MDLNYILKKLNINKVINNHKVTGLFIDSRSCINNSIFFLYDSNKEYLKEAIFKGAKTIISDYLCFTNDNINYIKVSDVKKTMAEIAKIYYKDVSSILNLIGFTGTNGKTSCSTIAYSFFNYIGYKSMLIGSNGIFYLDKKVTINNTTPDILTIYKYLNIAYKLGIRYVFMEVSSIGIDQLRIHDLNFKVLLLTNLKQDHLDYHKSLDNYYNCKLIPFLSLNKDSYAVINVDDENSNRFIKHIKSNILTYGINNNSNMYGKVLEIKEEGSKFIINSFPFKTNLLGKFNIYNLLCVSSLLEIFKLSYLDYSYFLKDYKCIDGRMNKYVFDSKNIIIDYAHTYSAVKEVIEYVKEISKNDLYIIIGCGGNREKEKRYMIGKLLNDISANIILTTDNPRYEEPIDIINDIKEYINKDIDIIINRKEAIIQTLKKLKENDYLLIIGKGSEPYMDIKGIKYNYSDLGVINEYYQLC